MIRLDLKREPHWLDLGHGVRLHVRPCTTALMMTGSCEHDARLSQLEARSREPLQSVRTKSVTPIARRIIRTGDVGVERPASIGSIA
jgi:hypothetical protein